MSVAIPILMYHQVCPEVHPEFRKFTVTTEKFSAQMNILKRLGFEAITFNELKVYKDGLNPLPSKPVIITFDDVLEDAIKNAVPVLENLGFRAVFYTPTEFVGNKSSWMISDVGAEFKLSGWQQIKELDAKGFEIGSHTMTHPHLTEISPEECYKELEGSRRALEDYLGHEVRHMAYPYGTYNNSVRNIASEAGYTTACTTEELISNSQDDLLLLPRLNIGMVENLADFILKVYTAHTPKGIFKKGIRTSKNFIPSPVRSILKKLLGFNK